MAIGRAAATATGYQIVSSLGTEILTGIEFVEFLDQTLDLSTVTVGTSGNDVLFGTNGNDTVDLMAGDDRYTAYAGADQINGNEGNDTLIGDQGDDITKYQSQKRPSKGTYDSHTNSQRPKHEIKITL